MIETGTIETSSIMEIPRFQLQSSGWPVIFMISRSNLVDHILTFAVLLILLAYTYLTLFVVPYIGFHFNNSNGRIEAVLIPATGEESLQVGDKLEQVGPVTWEAYRANQRQSLFENNPPGTVVKIVVSRGGESVPVNWMVPGFSFAEFRARVVDIWLLSYYFWFAGLVTVLIIRPADLRKALLVALFFLTAIWLMLGTVGGSHLWGSAILFRMVIWLSLPVYLHFHWIFPESIRDVSAKYWIPLYVVGVGLAITEWLQLLPANIYFMGFLFAMLGSIVLMFLHFILKKEQRRDVGTLAIIILLSFIPIAIAQTIWVFFSPVLSLTLSLLTLIGLPGAYFYIAYRRQPGWLEIRANRIVGLYIFLTLLFIINFTLIFVVAGSALVSLDFALYMVLLFANTLVAILGYPPFQRLIDRYLLGMPINRNKLVETYSARITASLDRNNLIHLLHNEVMPSLQILESGIIQRSSGNRGNTLYSSGISPDQIPSLLDFEDLLKTTNQTLPTSPKELSWVKLLIPLRLDGKPIGVWLFGRHDPDDVYSRTEIQLLETLGNQTAIALANIQQTEQLRKLYDANVHRHEEERTSLARTLHDDVLHSLATLRVDRLDEDRFQAAYKQVRQHIRDLLRGLRPALLDYGLWRAFDEMVDNLQEIS